MIFAHAAVPYVSYTVWHTEQHKERKDRWMIERWMLLQQCEGDSLTPLHLGQADRQGESSGGEPAGKISPLSANIEEGNDGRMDGTEPRRRGREGESGVN